MNFQIYSDLHLEFKNNFPKMPKMADYLILAGDIGIYTKQNYKKFIEYCSKTWEKIFIVLGNHEFYICSLHFNKVILKYQEFFNNYDNIYFLNKTKIDLDENTCILGSTFWTRANSFDVYNYINDFQRIKYFDHIKNRKFKLNIHFLNKINLEEKEWLKNSLDNIDRKNIIIISHFPLIRENTCHKKYENQPLFLQEYFSNNYLNILSKYENKNIYCISGHTHFSYDFKINNMRFISNQLGYEEDFNKNDFDENKVITIY